VKLSRQAASALARVGAGLWSNLHHRIREEALRLQVARQGEDLLSELTDLLARCQMLLEDARWAAGIYDLSASDQRGLIRGLEAYQARVRELEPQVRQALQDLVGLRGDALEGRSLHLSNLDVEICLLLSEVEDCEALCKVLRSDPGAGALPRVA
jgi:hypothetical protein